MLTSGMEKGFLGEGVHDEVVAMPLSGMMAAPTQKILGAAFSQKCLPICWRSAGSHRTEKGVLGGDQRRGAQVL